LLFDCIGGVTIFISLYWRSDNLYLIVLEEWQFLFNCIGRVTTSKTIEYKFSLLQYNQITIVTPPNQLNNNCHSSNTNCYLIVLEEWPFLFHCIGGVTIFISLYCRSDNCYLIVLELLQYNQITIVTPPIQLNNNCHSSNTIK
jgi:hypothetical protein